MTPDLSLQPRPLCPELILAVGALVLLMVGVFRGERADDRDQRACRSLLLGRLASWSDLFRPDGAAPSAAPSSSIRSPAS